MIAADDSNKSRPAPGTGTTVMSRGKAEKKAARGERLSAALRENLKRRKAQARGRAEGREESRPGGGGGNQSPSPAKADDERQTPDFRRNRGRD
jgi:hypothetical protein